MDSTEDFLQIGGHENAFEMIGLYKIRKLTCKKESEFYQELQNKESLSKLKPFTPTFHHAMQFQQTGKNDFYVTLENLVEPFKNPNILDLKLGMQLYDEDANIEKKQRMIEKCSRTTSGSLGLRIAGMKYANGKVHDKEFGRQLNQAEFKQELLKFIHPIQSPILNDVVSLRNALSTIEGRFISSSILIIYESENPCKYTFKLIDFAHTTVKPGIGAHQDILESLDRFISILQESQ